MVILAAAAAAAATGSFTWNREGFFFERELQQKRDYQGQEMQIRQFELYREDIRDLVQLTVRKMDNYLLVNTLQLGFCVTLFTDGRPQRKDGESNAPMWLIGIYAMCNAGAFFYYLLSIWLAMHASISAHSFGVRMLTQCVRLPVPGKAQLDQSAARATDFENMNFRDVLRIPLWRQQLDKLSRAMNEASNEGDPPADDESAGPPADSQTTIHPVTKLGHVMLFRKLQANWQAYDAYARVCMAMGTNQVLQALSYETLILLNAENNDRWPSLICVAVFTCCAWIIAKLDLWLSPRILCINAVLLILPPVCACISLEVVSSDYNFSSTVRGFHKVLVPAVYTLHVAWIGFTCYIAKATGHDGVKLPNNFRSVTYLDVFNWLNHQEVRSDSTDQQFQMREEAAPEPPQELPAQLREVLDEDCRNTRRALQADLARWEDAQVQRWLVGNERDQQDLKEIRATFNMAARELDRAQPAAGGASSSSGRTGRSDEGPVYLRMEYNPGEMHVYWYNVEAAQVRWGQPRDGRISDVEGLRLEVEDWAQKVGTLLGRRLDEPQAAAAPSRRGASPRASPRASPQASPRTSPRTSPRLREATSAAPGGPPGPGMGSMPPARPAARVSAKPGELPWDTVQRGSRALMFAWFCGVVWTILYYWFKISIPFHDDDHHIDGDLWELTSLQSLSKVQPDLHGNSTSGGLGAWPAALLRPVGAACDEALSGVVLIADKYKVDVHVDAGAPAGRRRALAAALREALDVCLLASPEFHEQGLAGISLDCSGRPLASSGDAEGCHAWLLSASGRQVLRCGLTTSALASQGPELLELRGGRWRALVSGFGGSLLALAEDGATVAELERRGRELLPRHASPVCGPQAGAGPCGEAAVRRLGPVAGLGLHRDGRGRLLLLGRRAGSDGPYLGVLPMVPDDHHGVRHWRKLRTSIARKVSLRRTEWHGICRNPEGLWLLGTIASPRPSGDDGEAALWRLPLL